MLKLNKSKREAYSKNILKYLYADQENHFREDFLILHFSDQAEIFSSMDMEGRNRVYGFLRPEEFAEIFGHLSITDQKLFFLELDENYATKMLNSMFTDDIVNFLSEINIHRAEEILKGMNPQKAEKVEGILAYEDETAGAVMTKELISIASTETVGAVLEMLREEAPTAEIVYYLYVVDEAGILVGVVSLRDLIISSHDTTIEAIMHHHPVHVAEDLDQEEVGKIIKRYDLLAVPVTSQLGHLLGIITVDDVMDIMEQEATEDFGEISAAKGATDLNMSAFAAAKARSPWIIALMFLGLITGGVITRFEDTLEAVVLLAAFIPMIMDSAGNVGTQSLGVSVRGLALGTIEKNGVGRIIRREFFTGTMIGLISMVIITILILAIHQNAMLALIVGVSILFTLSISSVIGAVVPLIINKLKFDPAIASGPFITTFNDIIGLLIYFSIATYLMDFL